MLYVMEVKLEPTVGPMGEADSCFHADQDREVLKRLRLERLNVEENKQIQMYLTYQDIFHILGEALGRNTAFKQQTLLEPGEYS